MSKYQEPSILDVCEVVRFAAQCSCGLPDGREVPARPLGPSFRWQRTKAAWLVFTGRADALTWPGQ